MRTAFNLCLSVAAGAVALFGPPAARADDPYGDMKPSDEIHLVLDPQGTPRRPRPIDAGRYKLLHFDEQIERSSHHVGDLEADRSIYIATKGGGRLVADLWFHYRFEKGDSLPMLDQIYSATELRAVKRVTDPELMKNLPKDRMLIVVPVGSSLTLNICQLGGLHGEKSIIDPLKIAGSGTATSPRVVRLTAKAVARFTGHGEEWETKTYDAKAGDTVELVKDCQLTVKRIVPADEARNLFGWVEFSPVPAGHEAQLRKQTVDDLFTYATVGTDPAFKKALAERHLRKGLLAPREMRDLVASRRDVERISGPPRLEARICGSDLLLIWTFDAEFNGDAADAMPTLRGSLKNGARLRETKFYPDYYLAELLYRWIGVDPVSQRALAEQAATSGKFAIFGAGSGDDAECATVIAPEPLPGGKGYRQHFIWAAVGRWDIELPTLRQLVGACPMLKPPPSEKPFDEFLGDKQIWSCSVSFADDPAAGWSVEAAGEIRPELELLLAKQGFKESPRTVHVPLPNDENGTEQHTWQRSSDASSVSITPRGERIQIDYQTALPPK